MKNIRRILSLVLVVAFCLSCTVSVSACGKMYNPAAYAVSAYVRVVRTLTYELSRFFNPFSDFKYPDYPTPVEPEDEDPADVDVEEEEVDEPEEPDPEEGEEVVEEIEEEVEEEPEPEEEEHHLPD